MCGLQVIMGSYATPASLQIGDRLLSWNTGEVTWSSTFVEHVGTTGSVKGTFMMRPAVFSTLRNLFDNAELDSDLRRFTLY